MAKENIKITNAFIENSVNSASVINELREREFEPDIGYWVAYVLQKLQDLARIYLDEKQKLLKKFAKEKDEKDNIITNPDGTVTIENVPEFSEQLNKLLEVEIDFGISKIEIDFRRLPRLKVKEVEFLMNFFEDKSSKNEAPKKKKPKKKK